MKQIREYKLTLIGSVLALLVLVPTLLFEWELFELVLGLLHNLEQYQADELIIPALIFFIFAYLDLLGRSHRQSVESEKVKIYKAMLASTKHILNNFLNQMQLFKVTARNTPNFDPKVLKLYDEIICDATTQIDALAGIQELKEGVIIETVMPSGIRKR